MPGLLLDDLRLHRASDDAALKVLSVLPEVTRRAAERARERIHIDLSGWKQSRDLVPFLPIVQEAVWSDRKLLFMYGEPPTSRVIEPLGLVAKGSIWYVVAATRTYRVSRMLDAEVLNETFVRPASFNLATYWEASAAQFKEKLPRYEVVARARDTKWLAMFMRFGAIDSIDGDVVRMHFDSEKAALVNMLGADTEVIEPLELREKMLAAARTILERYTVGNALRSLE